ncbi:MAG: FAD-binding protein [Synergistaceae bacterium]|jgi:electron transfer flavoprotein alpha subunit|nr:FAD-binding protein [Synergistaceae bacterium]
MCVEIMNGITKIAVAAFASRKGYAQARELLTCAAHFASLETELWLLGRESPNENLAAENPFHESLSHESLSVENLSPENLSVENFSPENFSLPVDVVCQVVFEEPRLCSTEEWMPALMRLYERSRPQAILFYADLAGNELAVRLAARIEGSCATEALSLSMTDVLTVGRAAYGSNLTAQFDLQAQPWVLSVAQGAFEPINIKEKRTPERIVSVERLLDAPWHTELRLRPEKAEEGIETAEVVVVGGRGVGHRQHIEQLRRLAESMGGKLGGTRPAVLDGWLRHKDLIGASGNVVRPKLCLAMGVSGSGPFMAGVEKSDVLAAVNNDPDALIFKYCDVGVVEDCNAVAQELERIISKSNNSNKRTANS